MDLRKELEKRIDKKRAEIEGIRSEVIDLKVKESSAEAVVTELQSILKSLPKEPDEPEPEKELRRGGDVYKTREALRSAKSALYIDDILAKIGKEVNADTRRSLAGQLAFYVRGNQIFTRPAPNTFGLKEFENFSEQEERKGGLFDDNQILETTVQ